MSGFAAIRPGSSKERVAGAVQRTPGGRRVETVDPNYSSSTKISNAIGGWKTTWLW